MKLTLHLARGEARNARALLLGAAVAATALAFGAAWIVARFDGDSGGELGGAFVLLATALATVLGGGAVAAETFAGDASSRRIDGAALLPSGLGRVFAAKALVVLAVSAAMAAWTALSAVAAVAVFAPGALGRAAESLGDVPSLFVALLPVLAAIVLFAIVLEHGLGSILAGIVSVLGAVAACVLTLPLGEWNVVPQVGDPSPLLALPFVPVIAGAAWLAFVHGPIHLGLRVRRAALGLGVALTAILGGGSAAAAWLDARVDFAPGDADARVVSVHASPDGGHAILLVANERAPATCHAWLVDLATGRTVVLPGRYRRFRDWTPNGGVRVAGHGRWSIVERRVEESVDTFDVRTGRRLRTQSEEQVRAEPRDAGWARIAQTTDGWRVEWRDRGLARVFDGALSVGVSPVAGRGIAYFPARPDDPWGRPPSRPWPGRAVVFSLDGQRDIDLPRIDGSREWWIDAGRRLRYFDDQFGRLHVLDCETGEDRTIDPPVGQWYACAGGTYGLAWLVKEQEHRVIDLRDLGVVGARRPWRWIRLLAGADGHAVAADAGDEARLLDLATDASAPLGMTMRDAQDRFVELAAGRFLRVQATGSLDILDAEGRAVRRVALSRAE